MPTETGLLTKAEVKGVLGVSNKTVERYMQTGRLVPVDHQPPKGGGRKMPLFRHEDVERLKVEQDTPTARPIRQPETSLAVASGALIPDRSPSPTDLAEAVRELARALAPARPEDPDELLTVEDAAREFRLSPGRLTKIARPVGPRRALRIRRQDVRRLIREIFEGP